MKQKRFQFWGSINGKPQIMWSKWYNFAGQNEPIQLKGFKDNNLRNEYREI